MHRLAEFSFVALIMRRFRHQATAEGQHHSLVKPDSQDDFGYSFDPHSINIAKPNPQAPNFDTGLSFKQNNKCDDVQDTSFGGDGFDTETVPEDFNEDAFLSGAKSAYKMLQETWDDGDLTEIRRLSTDKSFTQIKNRLQQRQQQNKTEIFSLDAQLLYIHELEQEWEAAVLFDSTLQESVNQAREIWHFIRPIRGQHSTWLLDGIQQLEY